MKYNKYQLLNSSKIYRIVMICVFTVFLMVYVSKAYNTRSYKEYYYDADRHMFATDNSNLMISYRDYMMLKYHGYCFSIVHVILLICFSFLFFISLSFHNDITLSDIGGRFAVICSLVIIILIIIFV